MKKFIVSYTIKESNLVITELVLATCTAGAILQAKKQLKIDGYTPCSLVSIKA